MGNPPDFRKAIMSSRFSVVLRRGSRLACRLLSVSFALASIVSGKAAQAIALCVNSNATLDAALSIAAASPDAVTLRFATGTYPLTGRFVDLPRPTTLLGGYNADCSARKAIVNAYETVIDMSGGALHLQQNKTSDNLVAIDGLSIVNANPFRIYAGTFGDQGTIQVSRSHIGGVPASNATLDFVAFGGGSVTLDNVLVDKMPSGMPIGTCAQIVNLVEGGTLLVNNSTIDVAPNRQLCLEGDASTHEGDASFANSIVWSSVQTAGIDSASMATINMINSTFFSLNRNGAAGTTVAAIQTTPLWVDPFSGNYLLQGDSTAVNSGTAIFPGGLSATDILGHTRWLGSAPDRGAFESAFNDATQYSVITTADSGVGSLRDAITQANVSSNPATITFNIPGNCPRAIALASALPQILTPVIVDGTTQPGSSVNASADTFDADLCVVLKPAGGTLPYGFNVPAAATIGSLTLRGVGLGGFSQPVMLLGGSNHVIAGNQFGGSVAGVPLPGASLSAISIGVNASGSLIVGGNNLADRNVIGGADFSGINVAGTVSSSTDRCQIVNNLIGVAANGNTALPNFTGINLAGSGCLVDRNRIVGNSNDAIWINGSSHHVIQRNRIGYTLGGGGFFSGAGVRVSGNGSNNTIGAPAASNVSGSFYANTIRNMLQGGVLIESGSNNAVRTNLIYDNGASNNGMDIDLGAAGPLANDAGDGDDGANHLQNFPTATALLIGASSGAPVADVAATVSASLDAPPGSYRIDAYFSPRCDNTTPAGGRPHAQAFIGTAQVTLPAPAGALKINVVLPTLSGNPLIGLAATDAAGNTSEIGTCFATGNAQFDRIFQSGFN